MNMKREGIERLDQHPDDLMNMLGYLFLMKFKLLKTSDIYIVIKNPILLSQYVQYTYTLCGII